MNLDATLLVWDLIWAGVGALGFAMLFNVPVRTLPACVLCGGLGYTVRAALMQLGVGVELATLGASAFVGLLGELFARRWYTPATVFTICGAIAMIPGALAFETMLGLIRLSADATPDLLAQTASEGVRTAIILAAIAVGVSAPKFLSLQEKPAL